MTLYTNNNTLSHTIHHWPALYFTATQYTPILQEHTKQYFYQNLLHSTKTEPDCTPLLDDHIVSLLQNHNCPITHHSKALNCYVQHWTEQSWCHGNCSALLCAVLCCTLLHCTDNTAWTEESGMLSPLWVVHSAALHFTKLYCTALRCNALYYTAINWSALLCTALHCTVL